MRKLLTFMLILGVAACSDATEAVHSDATISKVKTETARYFGTSTGNVRVGSFRQTMLGTEYKAKVAGRLYDCHYVRGTVSCTKA